MMDSVFVSMDLIRLPFCVEESSTIRCEKCYDELERHQLDIALPGRMLGTCESCKAWYLIDLEGGVMVLLPDEADLRGI
ncbi:hypothetical protein V5E97_39320 [Singulisphaera sp. Ch08]|uniref:Uncharacterized protein n=1 Tax=Singulisphaera sp. Ch08 TaxID=3120278 RepID=A0AAU7CGX9_9BACT